MILTFQRDTKTIQSNRRPSFQPIAWKLPSQGRYPRPLADLEAEAIQKAILYFEGNMTKAAEALGIAKSTLYRKIDSK